MPGSLFLILTLTPCVPLAIFYFFLAPMASKLQDDLGQDDSLLTVKGITENYFTQFKKITFARNHAKKLLSEMNAHSDNGTLPKDLCFNFAIPLLPARASKDISQKYIKDYETIKTEYISNLLGLRITAYQEFTTQLDSELEEMKSMSFDTFFDLCSTKSSDYSNIREEDLEDDYANLIAQIQNFTEVGQHLPITKDIIDRTKTRTTNDETNPSHPSDHNNNNELTKQVRLLTQQIAALQANTIGNKRSFDHSTRHHLSSKYHKYSPNDNKGISSKKPANGQGSLEKRSVNPFLAAYTSNLTQSSSSSSQLHTKHTHH